MTFLTQGPLGFDIDMNACCVGTVHGESQPDLRAGMALVEVQSQPTAALSSDALSKLWRSAVRRRPLALTFSLGVQSPGPEPEEQEQPAAEQLSSPAQQPSETIIEHEWCAKLRDKKLVKPERWRVLAVQMAAQGWSAWGSAKRRRLGAGERLVGRRVAVLGKGLGTVLSYDARAKKKIGKKSGAHLVQFEQDAEPQSVKLLRDSSQWLVLREPRPLPRTGSAASVGSTIEVMID